MAVEGVREVDVINDWSPAGDLDTDSISVRSWDSTEVEGKIRGYDFGGQTVYKAEFDYSPTSGFGRVQTIEGRIQLRTGSGLLVIESDEQSSDLRNVVEELTHAVNGNVEIETRFVPERKRIWDFLSYGEPVRIQAVTPFSGVQRVSFEDSEPSSGINYQEAVGDYPIELAVVKFSYDEEEFEVKYVDDKIHIDTSDSEKIEYVIQIFESAIVS